MTLEEGQILFREGDPGENLYVVRDGELQGKSTLGTAINTYGPGALIGELAFLKHEPYTETITATEDCELIEITPDALDKSLEQEPAWFSAPLDATAFTEADCRSPARTSGKATRSRHFQACSIFWIRTIRSTKFSTAFTTSSIFQKTASMNCSKFSMILKS